jgi:hypothetical protein
MLLFALFHSIWPTAKQHSDLYFWRLTVLVNWHNSLLHELTQHGNTWEPTGFDMKHSRPPCKSLRNKLLPKLVKCTPSSSNKDLLRNNSGCLMYLPENFQIQLLSGHRFLPRHIDILLITSHRKV